MISENLIIYGPPIAMVSGFVALLIGNTIREKIEDLPRNAQWKRLGISSPSEGLPVFYLKQKHNGFTRYRYWLHEDMPIKKILKERHNDICREFGKGKPVSIVQWSDHLVDIYIEDYVGASLEHQKAIEQRPRIPKSFVA